MLKLPPPNPTVVNNSYKNLQKKYNALLEEHEKLKIDYKVLMDEKLNQAEQNMFNANKKQQIEIEEAKEILKNFNIFSFKS